MEYRKSYLTNFILYCENENALNDKRESNLTYINLEYAKSEWNRRKKDRETKYRYELNFRNTKDFLENVPFVHYTNVNSLIGIFRDKAILSINEMDKRDISFHYRIPSQGLNEQMHKYVFACSYEGDWLYGPCKIVFKKETAKLGKACFSSRSWCTIPEHQLKNHLYSLKDWMLYMTENIALSYSDPQEYFRTTPVYDRPEILFEDKVPIDYAEKIIVNGRPAYDELCSRIRQESEDAASILSIIEWLEAGDPV